MLKVIKRLKEHFLSKKGNTEPTDEQVKEASVEMNSKMQDIMKAGPDGFKDAFIAELDKTLNDRQ
ncbi:hypothetical protein [Lacticaseibacillus rhamnosus]|uniref:hypothetical protein n=1 Tax=Lacticaseibacillus rhamnosus TaxID=47715 RepID=UPI0004E2055F|nr:hypothetical protein [Lacticaseibacillus rhamnosus]